MSKPKLNHALLLRYLEAASEFDVGRFTIERHYQDGSRGWAVRYGCRIYDRHGAQWWPRRVASRWHSGECHIEDFGEAFALAETLERRRIEEENHRAR